MDSPETRSLTERTDIPGVLSQPYRYAVLMPYSQNLRGNGKQRLSFYSAFATNSAVELYKAGKLRNLILCGETTFGEELKTTSDLQKEALLRLGVREEDIIVLRRPNLNNTAIQIKAVADFQKENGLQNEKFLVIVWRFHDERVVNHVKGFGLNAQTVIAEDAHKLLRPAFKLGELGRVLPKEFEERERMPRRMSQFDRKGVIPGVLTSVRGGSVTDIVKERDNEDNLTVNLLNTTGKKRLREVQGKS